MLTDFENNTKVNNLTKESFRSLLELATLDSFFIFDGKYYKQKDGVAVGSSLVPAVANVFLGHFEEQWMPDCPIDYKPISYRRYVDDTFLLFSSELPVTKFLNYMNSKHWDIKFTIEREENNSLSFLDIKSFLDILILKVFYPYGQTNITLCPLCCIVVLWFALLIEFCILKF